MNPTLLCGLIIGAAAGIFAGGIGVAVVSARLQPDPFPLALEDRGLTIRSDAPVRVIVSASEDEDPEPSFEPMSRPGFIPCTRPTLLAPHDLRTRTRF